MFFRELLAQKGAFAAFLIQYLQENFDNEDLAEIEDQIDDVELRTLIRQTSVISKRLSMDRSSREGSLKRRSSRRSSQQSETKSPTEKPRNKLIETEDSATGSVGYGVYLRYFKSVGVPFALTILLFNAINQGMSVTSNCKKLLREK